jgi:hypothetical protein
MPSAAVKRPVIPAQQRRAPIGHAKDGRLQSVGMPCLQVGSLTGTSLIYSSSGQAVLEGRSGCDGVVRLGWKGKGKGWRGVCVQYRIEACGTRDWAAEARVDRGAGCTVGRGDR